MKTNDKNRPGLKGFMLSLAATTVSIILTFGTTAIIERNKQNADKREMVMMIMYDMQQSLQGIEQCEKNLEDYFDLQLDLLAHPDRYDEQHMRLVSFIPVLEYSTTVESIFRNNIETINTIGSILFVESVSSFYDIRIRYKEEVLDPFYEEGEKVNRGYDNLSDFNMSSYIFISQLYLVRLHREFEQCKLMMKVSDDDLAVFSDERSKLLDDIMEDESMVEIIAECRAKHQQRNIELERARSEGRKALQ